MSNSSLYKEGNIHAYLKTYILEEFVVIFIHGCISCREHVVSK